MPNPISASFDLGFGGLLDSQMQDETEEERRKRKLGMATNAGNPLSFGRSGIASIDLGVPGAGVR